MAKKKFKRWEIHPGRGPIGARKRRRVLIVCEDTKSSVLYFKGFKVDPRRIELFPLGTGMNTDSLVEKAIELKAEAQRRKEPYNEIWCVFDRDSCPAHNYNRAFQLARNEGIFTAWANEAFEIWYLLHFDFHCTGMSRAEYRKRLKDCLKCEYDKADPQIFAKLERFQGIALKNARRLERHWFDLGESKSENQNPSTNIHKLVEFLNELGSLGPAEGEHNSIR